MNRAFSIAWPVFFIAGIAAKVITPFGWGIWYVSNKSYVANVLCENKNRPAMQCNGKCYLAKQLKKAEQEQQNSKQSAPSRHLKLKSVDWIPDAYSFEIHQMAALRAILKSCTGLNAPNRPPVSLLRYFIRRLHKAH